MRQSVGPALAPCSTNTGVGDIIPSTDWLGDQDKRVDVLAGTLVPSRISGLGELSFSVRFSDASLLPISGETTAVGMSVSGLSVGTGCSRSMLSACGSEGVVWASSLTSCSAGLTVFLESFVIELTLTGWDALAGLISDFASGSNIKSNSPGNR